MDRGGHEARLEGYLPFSAQIKPPSEKCSVLFVYASTIANFCG
jgi:hypothetical protein